MSDEYNGYANRETWAFCLHVNNDQGLYNAVREAAAADLADHPSASNGNLGLMVVGYVRDMLPEVAPELWENMREDVGSFWRIDYAEVGANVREMIDNG